MVAGQLRQEREVTMQLETMLRHGNVPSITDESFWGTYRLVPRERRPDIIQKARGLVSVNDALKDAPGSMNLHGLLATHGLQINREKK